MQSVLGVWNHNRVLVRRTMNANVLFSITCLLNLVVLFILSVMMTLQSKQYEKFETFSKLARKEAYRHLLAIEELQNNRRRQDRLHQKLLECDIDIYEDVSDISRILEEINDRDEIDELLEALTLTTKCVSEDLKVHVKQMDNFAREEFDTLCRAGEKNAN